jgi:putative endonuclease
MRFGAFVPRPPSPEVDPYGLTRLVWYEWHDDIRLAIQRETTRAHGRRAWKVRLIHGMNPDWGDLTETLNQ